MKCTLLLAGLLYFVSSCSQDEKVNTDPPQPKSEISEMSDEELEAYAESIGAITMDSLMSWIKACMCGGAERYWPSQVREDEKRCH